MGPGGVCNDAVIVGGVREGEVNRPLSWCSDDVNLSLPSFFGVARPDVGLLISVYSMGVAQSTLQTFLEPSVSRMPCKREEVVNRELYLGMQVVAGRITTP